MREYVVATTMAVTLILAGATAAQAWDGQPGDDNSQPASCQIQPSLTKSHWGLDFLKTPLDMRLVRRIDGFPFESSEWEGEMTEPIRRVTVCPAHD